jgi:hypothetical protein
MNNDIEIPGPDGAASEPIELDAPAPWEEIAPGRFMPRRVRGSCRGRVLG